MTSRDKIDLIRSIWLFLVIAMVAMAVFLDGLGIFLIPIFGMMLTAATATTHTIWNGESPLSQFEDQEYREKRKRDRVESALRNLSTEELQALRSRLNRGDLRDEDLYQMMSDDVNSYDDHYESAENRELPG